MSSLPRRGAVAAALSLCLALAACGGGTSSKYAGSTVDGQVLMDATAPVLGSGTVCMYAIANGQGNPLNVNVSPPASTGTLLTPGCISTDAQGQFSQALPNFYGPVLVQITGGSYLSAATHSIQSLSPLAATNASLQAVVFVGGGGTVNVQVTPLTTIATAIANAMPGGLTTSNYAAASAKAAAEFQLGAIDIANTLPVAGDAQDKVLFGIEQYLASPPGSSDDAGGANLLNWNTGALAQMSSDFTTSYNAINGTSASFSFY